jgi:hypothetical protein
MEENGNNYSNKIKKTISYNKKTSNKENKLEKSNNS